MGDDRPVLLDLFCGAGGAAKGYHDAGFRVIGVDWDWQPRYPYEFICADAMSFPLAGYDAIHASPPCQAYSRRTPPERKGDHPDLVDRTRDMLARAGVPYVIENVVGAPLIDPILLCGTMFPPLRVIRHRLFECTFPVEVPRHPKHPLIHTLDQSKPHYGKLDPEKAFVQVVGSGTVTRDNARDAMGIDWMRKVELNQAIPPPYTQHIGTHLLLHIA